jgi:hypothetical protein
MSSYDCTEGLQLQITGLTFGKETLISVFNIQVTFGVQIRIGTLEIWYYGISYRYRSTSCRYWIVLAKHSLETTRLGLNLSN